MPLRATSKCNNILTCNGDTSKPTMANDECFCISVSTSQHSLHLPATEHLEVSFSPRCSVGMCDCAFAGAKLNKQEEGICSAWWWYYCQFLAICSDLPDHTVLIWYPVWEGATAGRLLMLRYLLRSPVHTIPYTVIGWLRSITMLLA